MTERKVFTRNSFGLIRNLTKSILVWIGLNIEKPLF